MDRGAWLGAHAIMPNAQGQVRQCSLSGGDFLALACRAGSLPDSCDCASINLHYYCLRYILLAVTKPLPKGCDRVFAWLN
jgi:hypothetical protein